MAMTAEAINRHRAQIKALMPGIPDEMVTRLAITRAQQEPEVDVPADMPGGSWNQAAADASLKVPEPQISSIEDQNRFFDDWKAQGEARRAALEPPASPLDMQNKFFDDWAAEGRTAHESEMPDFSDVEGYATSPANKYRAGHVRDASLIEPSTDIPDLSMSTQLGTYDPERARRMTEEDNRFQKAMFGGQALTGSHPPIHDASLDTSLLGLPSGHIRDASLDPGLLGLKPQGGASAGGTAPADYSWLTRPEHEATHPNGPMGAARIGPPASLAAITAREVGAAGEKTPVGMTAGVEAFSLPNGGTIYRSGTNDSIYAQDARHNFPGRGDINADEYAGLRGHAFQPDTSAPDISLASYVQRKQQEAEARRAAKEAADIALTQHAAAAPDQLAVLGAEYRLRGQGEEALQRLRNQGAMGQLQFKAQADAQRQEAINREIAQANEQMAPLQRELAALNSDPRTKDLPAAVTRRAELETQLKQLQGILNTRLAALLPHPQGSDDVGKLWIE